MTQEKLDEILERHKLWLKSKGLEGERADLGHTDLRNANLRDADLCHANLKGANLKGANLEGANLLGTNLEGANLRGANLDYASWPLWCGSLEAKIDKRIACQLLYHTVRAMQSVDDVECRAVCRDPKVVALANEFHHVEECGKITNEETITFDDMLAEMQEDRG